MSEAEAAFRALKNELATRPNFHQLESRTNSQVFVAVLGYAHWVTLKHLLESKKPDRSPAHALAIASSPHSTDIVLPDGRDIRPRRVTTPPPSSAPWLTDWALPCRIASA